MTRSHETHPHLVELFELLPTLNKESARGATLVICSHIDLLLERILWVARDSRPFLEVGDYLGPDRRFRHSGYEGVERRADMIRKANAMESLAL